MNIKDDSRRIKKGDTFIALKKDHDGHEYVMDAIKNGASRVIVEKGSYPVDTVIVSDTHEYLVEYLKNNYYDEIKDLKLIGITGTNGKTTTAFLIYEAFLNIGIKAAYIGTIGFYKNGEYRRINNTTPDILEIYELLLECSKDSISYVVMECSSQGLDMNRLSGLHFIYGIFTNLTRDHLDYHKTMENYLNCKLKLFDMCDRRIVNSDSEYSKYFINENTVTYGFNSNDYKISSYDTLNYKTTFKLNDIVYETSLIGLHNIYNLSIVIILFKELNLDLDVSKLYAPNGRMDVIKKDSNLIIVDYAHTPDAVEKIINTALSLKPNNVITIVGCGGNRDKTKRPIMGSIATKLSSYCIFTSDNPRGEEELSIINDILKGVTKDNYEVVINRKKAIIKGIQKLKKNDILLVLGKGHEDYQIIKDKRIYFDDKKIVLENLWR